MRLRFAVRALLRTELCDRHGIQTRPALIIGAPSSALYVNFATSGIGSCSNRRVTSVESIGARVDLRHAQDSACLRITVKEPSLFRRIGLLKPDPTNIRRLSRDTRRVRPP